MVWLELQWSSVAGIEILPFPFPVIAALRCRAAGAQSSVVVEWAGERAGIKRGEAATKTRTTHVCPSLHPRLALNSQRSEKNCCFVCAVLRTIEISLSTYNVRRTNAFCTFSNLCTAYKDDLWSRPTHLLYYYWIINQVYRVQRESISFRNNAAGHVENGRKYLKTLILFGSRD